MSLYRCSFLCVAFLLGMMANQAAYAFRCGGALVTEGESKISVRNKCGEPDWIDRWFEEIVEHPDSDLEHRTARTRERWIYNPGPTQFLHILTFRGSKVSEIETGGRGFTVAPGIQRCDFNTFSLKTTAAEVAARCGEPVLKEHHFETVTRKTSGGRREISVTVDEWTFNLGPTRFMRVLTFHNGSLVEIKTGERGFKD